jgi:stage V sporulation protein G
MEKGLEFKITRLYRLETDGAMKAFVDVVVNDILLLRGLRIIEGKKGLFVSMPKQQGKDSRWYDTVRPLSKELREEISRVVLNAYEQR